MHLQLPSYVYCFIFPKERVRIFLRLAQQLLSPYSVFFSQLFGIVSHAVYTTQKYGFLRILNPQIVLITVNLGTFSYTWKKLENQISQYFSSLLFFFFCKNVFLTLGKHLLMKPPKVKVLSHRQTPCWPHFMWALKGWSVRWLEWFSSGHVIVSHRPLRNVNKLR